MFSLFVVIVGLIYGSKESSQSFLGRPRLWGPSEALVKTVVEFHCELLIYPQNETILLQLYKQDNREKPLAEYTSLDGEVALFPLIVKPYHEGDLDCVAKAQNDSNIEPTASSTRYLKVITKVQGAAIVVRSGSVEMFEGATLELNCTITAGNYVSYKWLLNNKDISQPHHHNDRLLINRTTSADSGSYVCVATNSFNRTENFTSVSPAVNVTVKEGVSEPNISFKVIKEDSHSFSAAITCQSMRGTPPVTFSLYNDTELIEKNTVDDRNATFKIPLILDQHMGRVQCQADNGNGTTVSRRIPLKIVPVAGPVTMHYDYDLGQNYAVIGMRFYCKAAKGSFPRYHWFLNNTLLTEEHNRENFYRIFNQPPEQSILLLSIEWSSAGTYHCEVSDSFDNSTVISSKKLYLDQDVMNRLPLLVVVVVFGSFTFLILMVSLCCCMGVIIRRRLPPQKSPMGWEMNRVVMEVDSNLDSSEYNEDPDVVAAAREDDFDQESLVSVDEWPQIAKQKKTLGGEPVEED